jgi:hypothetical protein
MGVEGVRSVKLLFTDWRAKELIWVGKPRKTAGVVVHRAGGGMANVRRLFFGGNPWGSAGCELFEE